MTNSSNRVLIRCGDMEYELQLPQGINARVVEPNHVEKAVDPQQMIRDALDHPIDSLPIEKMVKPGQKVCIISDDNTRFTPVDLILHEMLPRLEGAGIAKQDIVIVMALGSHRHMTEEEMIKKVGRRVFDNYRVINSEFHDQDKLVAVGKSSLGTPIRVIKDAMDADVRIGLGTIAPHGCMGWSGGAKILYPGITSEDIVSEFHAMQGLEDGILFGMEECPIRLAVEEWTAQIGLHFIVNVVLTAEMELYRAVAGQYVKAHRVGVAYAKEVCGAELTEKPNVILVSSYPLKADWWQCGKALYGGGAVIEKSGTMLLLAPCTEGMGPHKDVNKYAAMKNGEEELKAKIEAGETGEDLLTMAVGVSIGKISKYSKVGIISDGVAREEMESGGYLWYSEKDLQKAFDEAIAAYTNPKVLVITTGGETVPYIKRT